MFNCSIFLSFFFCFQEDGCSYSQHDTLSMLQGAGLHNQLACDWLIALYRQLREKLTASEKPGLCDLLRSAMIVKQQQEKGIDLDSALRHAAESVYVRNMKSLVARQVGRPAYLYLRKKQNWDSLLVECQISDRKVTSSNPGWSGRRMFFSRVNFVC